MILVMVTVGQKVKNIRERLGFTQSDLSQKSGVSLSTVQKLEGGKNKPRRPTLRVVAESLGLSLEELDRPKSGLLDASIEDEFLALASKMSMTQRQMWDILRGGYVDDSVTGVIKRGIQPADPKSARAASPGKP